VTASLQNIKFEIANSASASGVPAATAMRNQFRDRGRGLESLSICDGRSCCSREQDGKRWCIAFDILEYYNEL
jgi:hypothetical protein